MSRSSIDDLSADDQQVNNEPLLSVTDLEVVFRTEEGVVQALEGVDYEVHESEILGIIGESGCGKSVTARTALGLLDRKAEVRAGEIHYRGRDLLAEGDAGFRSVRGTDIAMIFQEPQASLNPVFTVQHHLLETLDQTVNVTGEAAHDRAIELLESVQLPAPESVLEKYPHQLSGGQQQRVMVALALACEPDILIADEPTTALDVTVQAQILQLLSDLIDEFDVSVMLITHNLGVVAQVCDRVSVMYAGSVVETAPANDLFANPQHPYTRQLLQSIPTLTHDTDEELPTISGVVPDLVNPPSGCRFRSRCREVIRPDVAGLSEEGWTRVVELSHDLADGRPVDDPRSRFTDVELGQFEPDVEVAVDMLERGETDGAQAELNTVLAASPCAAERPPEVSAGMSNTRCLLYGGEDE